MFNRKYSTEPGNRLYIKSYRFLSKNENTKNIGKSLKKRQQQMHPKVPQKEL